ncbi:hypothetical protein [Chryseobacterium defluvii]|uniref:Uncharacterized protein n=1 Tax=Chryseobacterium defluvii TaxID=160396 RepID=A0A495SLN1_9FLAO|nr:hypothetical protein [Chryseobacterium defluvii]RKT01083.1 hypothetical protein BCF58_0297 [Chryseobacterium defluvii]
MTEKLIQKALLKNWHSHHYKFINVFYFDNESDWLSFLPSGICYEVEIKISRSDFKADFKKPKHEIHEKNDAGKGYYIEKRGGNTLLDPSWEFCKNFPELVIAEEHRSYRHNRYNEMDIRLYYIPYSTIEIREMNNLKLPNKFFYAVPEGMIIPDEVPSYAGLLYIDENLKVKKVKDGKFIHKDILSPTKLFNKTYNSYVSNLYSNLNKVS